MANRSHRRPRSQLTPSLLAIAAALLVIFLAAAIMYVLMPLITVSDGGTASNAISAPRTSGASLTLHVSPTPASFDIEAPEATNTPTATSTPSPTQPATQTPGATATTAVLALVTVPPPATTADSAHWSAGPTATAPRVAGAGIPAAPPTSIVVQPPTAVPSPTSTATSTPSPTATPPPSPTATATPDPTPVTTTAVPSDAQEPTAQANDVEATGRRPHTHLPGSPVSN